jgi:hypothetical protein
MGSKSVVLPATVVIAMVLLFAASTQARPYGALPDDLAHEDDVLTNQFHHGAFDLNQAGATFPVPQEVIGFALGGERPDLTIDTSGGFKANY